MLLTRLDVNSSELTVVRDVVVVGLGIGLMMQTLTVAVQNSVGYGRIGVATASTQFFRTVGAMAGVTVMGAIVTAQLGGDGTRGVAPAALAGAIHPIFVIAIGLAAVALAAVIFVPHIELKQTLEETVKRPKILEEGGVSRAPNAERLAEGIVRVWMELQRRKEGASSMHELTTTQALAPRVAVSEGPQRMGALAERLGVTVATASRTVDALVAAGLVRREPDPADARAVQVVATPRGRREFRLRKERFARALARLSDELSEIERRQLADALETLGRLFGADLGQARASAGRPKS